MKSPENAVRPASEIRHHSSHWGAFRAEVREGRLVGVSGAEQDPEPSPILQSIPEALYSESRIAQPAVRAGWLKHGPGGNREKRGAEPFVPVSWDKALELVAAEIERVRKQHGNASIFAGSYGWASAGRFHNAKTQLARLLNTVGGFTDQVTTYSNAASRIILTHVLGSPAYGNRVATTWETIARHTRLMVLFGGLPLKNTQIGNGGIAEHRSLDQWRAAKAAGVQFVNVSPIRGDAADFFEAEWVPLRPNTDTAFMLGLAHTLVTEGLHDRAFLDRYCVGYQAFEQYLLGGTDGVSKHADWAAAITEIPAETIRALARRMASSRSLVATNWALQRADHGEQPYWMTVTLAAMLGQIGLPGGGFGFGYGSMGGVGDSEGPTASPQLSAGKNPTDSWIPVARISDMLLHPGEPYDFNGERRTYPDIRLIFWCGGNPFHHHQDLNRLVRAWQRPETIVIQDPWWTATARYADIVLPATTTLERNDVGACPLDRFLVAMQQAVEPVGEARSDHDIFCGLADRLGTGEAFTEGRSEMEWLRHLYDSARRKAAERGSELPTFDTFWETGSVDCGRPKEATTLLVDFREDPEQNRLATPSGRIEIFSETIAGFGYDDCPPHATWLEPVEWLGSPTAEKFPLHMISNQPNTRLHGQMDNGVFSRESKVQGREPVWIHPADAGARGIADGDVVRVFNGRGALLAGAVVTERVRPGVVQLSTGAWYDPAEPGVVGSLEKHGNPNVLTMDKGTSKLGQGPIAHSALVEIARYEGDPPEVTAFRPPPMEGG